MPRPGSKIEKSKDFKGSVKKMLSSLKPWRIAITISFILAISAAIISIITPNKLSDLTNYITEGLKPNMNETTITENGVTIQTEEEHDYDYKHQTIWRDNQEYVLFAFIETGYTLTKTVTGTYSGNISFSEVTTETMSRSLSRFDAIGVPEDWSGKLDMVDSETITRSTVRTGAPEPKADMPPYAPPFDSQIERKYSRGLRGKYLVCNETEKRYEARQVGYQYFNEKR